MRMNSSALLTIRVGFVFGLRVCRSDNAKRYRRALKDNADWVDNRVSRIGSDGGRVWEGVAVVMGRVRTRVIGLVVLHLPAILRHAYRLCGHWDTCWHM